jgi:hypothetical protein
MATPVRKLQVENFHVGFQNLEAGRCRLLASNPVKLTAADPRVWIRAWWIRGSLGTVG